MFQTRTVTVSTKCKGELALGLWCYAIFNHISVISSRLVLLVEETGVPRNNHRHVTSH